MIDVIFLVFLVYYVVSSMLFCLYNSYTFMRFVYSTSYWIFSKMSFFFTRLANYFYTRMEEHESQESRYLFDSDDDMSEDEIRDLNEPAVNANTMYDNYIIREFRNEQYPANFTSIYIDPHNLK